MTPTRQPRAMSITWFGHATFLIESPGGKRLVFDPWLTGNPSCPDNMRKIDRADVILVTHGHSDHTTDVVSVARATGAAVVANHEICLWLDRKGIRNLVPMNHGGTVEAAGLAITMTAAVHSSSVEDDGQTLFMGEPGGFVVRLEDGQRFYFAGDTAVFGDMRLIAELYQPVIAFLPIGDRYTMGPEQAAKACELLGVRQVVPMHFGTFPLLTGRPERLRELVQPLGVEVLDLKPGETAR